MLSNIALVFRWGWAQRGNRTAGATLFVTVLVTLCAFSGLRLEPLLWRRLFALAQAPERGQSDSTSTSS